MPHVRGVSAGASVLGDLGVGLREVLSRTWLWLLIGQALLYHLVYGGAQGVLGPIVVGDGFGRAAWGWALASLMAGFRGRRPAHPAWRPRHGLRVGVAMLSLTAAFPLAMAVSDQLVLVLLGAFVHGLGLEVFSVAWDLSIQQNVPETGWPGLLLRPGRLLRLPPGGPGPDRAGGRGGRLRPVAARGRGRHGRLVAAALLSRDVRRLERHAPPPLGVDAPA